MLTTLLASSLIGLGIFDHRPEVWQPIQQGNRVSAMPLLQNVAGSYPCSGCQARWRVKNFAAWPPGLHVTVAAGPLHADGECAWRETEGESCKQSKGDDACTIDYTITVHSMPAGMTAKKYGLGWNGEPVNVGDSPRFVPGANNSKECGGFDFGPNGDSAQLCFFHAGATICIVMHCKACLPGLGNAVRMR